MVLIGNLLIWFENYLTMRNQVVFVNGVYSTKNVHFCWSSTGVCFRRLSFLI